MAHIGILEKNMEATTWGVGFIVTPGSLSGLGRD